jgi:hypothetical protein
MSVIIAENSASAIWQRTIETKRSSLDPAAARALLRLKFSPADLERADELAAKARAGSLTATEERELEDYRTVGTALEFLKSKARLALKRSSRQTRRMDAKFTRCQDRPTNYRWQDSHPTHAPRSGP